MYKKRRTIFAFFHFIFYLFESNLSERHYSFWIIFSFSSCFVEYFKFKLFSIVRNNFINIHSSKQPFHLVNNNPFFIKTFEFFLVCSKQNFVTTFKFWTFCNILPFTF